MPAVTRGAARKVRNTHKTHSKIYSFLCDAGWDLPFRVSGRPSASRPRANNTSANKMVDPFEFMNDKLFSNSRVSKRTVAKSAATKQISLESYKIKEDCHKKQRQNEIICKMYEETFRGLSHVTTVVLDFVFLNTTRAIVEASRRIGCSADIYIVEYDKKDEGIHKRIQDEVDIYLESIKDTCQNINIYVRHAELGSFVKEFKNPIHAFLADLTCGMKNAKSKYEEFLSNFKFYSSKRAIVWLNSCLHRGKYIGDEQEADEITEDIHCSSPDILFNAVGNPDRYYHTKGDCGCNRSDIMYSRMYTLQKLTI